MVAVRKDLTLDAGATFLQSFRYKDSNDVPVDLTGYTAEFRVMERGLGNSLVKAVECTVDDQGFIIAKITDEETDLLVSGVKAYALDLEDPQGNLNRIIYGRLTVREASDV